MAKIKEAGRMKKYDIIVVGGGPAGVVSAVTAKKYYPKKSVMLLKSVKDSVIPCAIPYMFSTLKKPEDNALGNAPLEKNGIEVIAEKVERLLPGKKTVETGGGTKYGYGKLIIATGSMPQVPPIPGIEKHGIYPILKDMKPLKELYADLKKAKNVAVIGGGFIGVEFADELSGIKGINVSLIEQMPRILANSFDEEFSSMAMEKLEEKGVKVLTNTSVKGFEGKDRVTSVIIEKGKNMPADVVVLGIGAVPDTELAKAAGLETGKSGGIIVDEYMRTSQPDIFAAGDCAEKKDFFTRNKVNIMLASTATAEARIAGANLWKLKLLRESHGTIAIYSTKAGGLALASAGLTERSALKEGFDIVVGNAEAADRHPGAMPGASKMRVKLIFSKESGMLLGGQVAGGESAGELINTIGLAIQKNVTVTEIETLQIATHPRLTPPPTAHPLIQAAQDAQSRM